MEIITSHSNTDFDGLAAMVAARKLYPEAKILLPGKLCRNVEDFMALHRDTLQVYDSKTVHLELVRKLIVVDTKSSSRLGSLQKVLENEDLEIVIYDHHPPSDKDLQGSIHKVEMVGATTTILVEELVERDIKLNSLEATVLALGIYEDTGCLTFSTSTSRDARAVAYLLEQGANLAIVGDFIGRPLTEGQKRLLNNLILSSKHLEFHGIKVLIAKTQVDEYIAGLALLTHKLAEIESVDIIISVVEMEDRVHVVARSRIDHVSVVDITREIGGAGHPKAASASVKDKTMDEIIILLEEALAIFIKPMTTAVQLMSYPVKTVFPLTTIDEAGKIMLRYGHSGLPVVDENLNIIGIISRRDVDKAKHHGLGHAPVKGYMSRRVISIPEDMPLRELQDIMIENNIGRLPVVKEGRLLGIVSRTDVLRTIHGEVYPERYRKIYLTEAKTEGLKEDLLRGLMSEKLPLTIREIFSRICYAADQKLTKVFVVGGFVRDLLLGVENYDIDLVVEGDGIEFAKGLAQFFCGRVRVHDKFGTAVVILPDGFKIDVATARTEYYEYPAALPTVETSTLKQDLYRRDFTINAMAIDLTMENFGQLVDYFGGRRDLEQGIVRVLYNLSFVEDPTRLFRAVRFEQRYNFSMERQTLELAQKAIKDKWPLKLSYDRIREEIKHIFNENAPINAINRMNELGLWVFVFPEIEVNEETKRVLKKLPRSNSFVACHIEAPKGFHPWLTYLITMVHQLELPLAATVCQRLRLSKEELEIVLSTLEAWPKVVEELENGESPALSKVFTIFQDLHLEAYAFIMAKAQDLAVTHIIAKYLRERDQLRLEINGNDLKNLGCPWGPLYKVILDKVLTAKLDGHIKGYEEELDYAKRLLEEAHRKEKS